MSDIPQIRLASLTPTELRLLAGNLRRVGRQDMAAEVARELDRRGRATLALMQEDSKPSHRGATAVVMAAAAAFGLAGVLVFGPDLGWDFGQPEPSERRIAPPRAMVARSYSPPAAPVAPEAIAPAEAPPPNIALAAREPSARPAPPAPARSERPMQLAARTVAPPSVTAEAPAPISEPEVEAPPIAMAAGGALAVSSSASVVAAACGAGATGSEGLVCEDARRTALNPGRARTAPIPLRVAITPSR